MMKKLSLAALALVACAGLAGCNDPISGNQDTFSQYPQVRMNSYWLQQNTDVQKPIVMRTGSGQIDVQVPIRNKDDAELIVDYQYRFLSAQGAEVEARSGWHNLRIPRKGIATIRFTSMTAMAEDFDVQIRYRK